MGDFDFFFFTLEGDFGTLDAFRGGCGGVSDPFAVLGLDRSEPLLPRLLALAFFFIGGILLVDVSRRISAARFRGGLEAEPTEWVEEFLSGLGLEAEPTEWVEEFLSGLVSRRGRASMLLDADIPLRSPARFRGMLSDLFTPRIDSGWSSDDGPVEMVVGIPQSLSPLALTGLLRLSRAGLSEDRCE